MGVWSRVVVFSPKVVSIVCVFVFFVHFVFFPFILPFTSSEVPRVDELIINALQEMAMERRCGKGPLREKQKRK